MGIQVDLLFEVGLIIFSDVMIDEGHWNNQRDILLVVVIDDLE
jgi:hypothetical protein